MKRFVVFALVVALSCPPVCACSCDEAPPPEIAFEQAAAVFVGHVVSLKVEVRREDGRDSQVIVCVFDNLERLKGVAEQEDQVTVLTLAQGTACGFPFRIDERYLVYAAKRDGSLRTSVCMRTKPLVRYPSGDEFTLRSADDQVDDRGLLEADLLRSLLKK